MNSCVTQLIVLLCGLWLALGDTIDDSMLYFIMDDHHYTVEACAKGTISLEWCQTAHMKSKEEKLHEAVEAFSAMSTSCSQWVSINKFFDEYLPAESSAHELGCTIYRFMKQPIKHWTKNHAYLPDFLDEFGYYVYNWMGKTDSHHGDNARLFTSKLRDFGARSCGSQQQITHLVGQGGLYLDLVVSKVVNSLATCDLSEEFVESVKARALAIIEELPLEALGVLHKNGLLSLLGKFAVQSSTAPTTMMTYVTFITDTIHKLYTNQPVQALYILEQLSHTLHGASLSGRIPIELYIEIGNTYSSLITMKNEAVIAAEQNLSNVTLALLEIGIIEENHFDQITMSYTTKQLMVHQDVLQRYLWKIQKQLQVHGQNGWSPTLSQSTVGALVLGLTRYMQSKNTEPTETVMSLLSDTVRMLALENSVMLPDAFLIHCRNMLHHYPVKQSLPLATMLLDTHGMPGKDGSFKVPLPVVEGLIYEYLSLFHVYPSESEVMIDILGFLREKEPHWKAIPSFYELLKSKMEVLLLHIWSLDDHLQYLLLDFTERLGSEWTLSNPVITALLSNEVWVNTGQASRILHTQYDKQQMLAATGSVLTSALMLKLDQNIANDRRQRGSFVVLEACAIALTVKDPDFCDSLLEWYSPIVAGDGGDWSSASVKEFVLAFLRDDTKETFLQLWRHISQYRLSFNAVNKRGERLFDCLQRLQQSPSLWYSSLLQVQRESKVYRHWNRLESLIDGIRKFDESCVWTDTCLTLRRELSPLEKKQLHDVFEEMHRLEALFGFDILYDPSSSQQQQQCNPVRIGLRLSSNNATLEALVPALDVQKDGCVVVAIPVNVIGHLLYHRIIDEIQHRYLYNKSSKFVFSENDEGTLYRILHASPIIHKEFGGSQLPYSRTKLSQWSSSSHSLAWAKDMLTQTMDEKNIPLILAVGKALMRIKFLIRSDGTYKERLGRFVRDDQLLTVAVTLLWPHLLAEKETGSGKSVIAALSGYSYAVTGRIVDIVTTTPVLADRDASNFTDFYKAFDLSVATSVRFDESRPRLCYSANIVYSDAMTLIGHYLSDIADENIRGGRPLDVLHLDEVDGSLRNDISKKVLKSQGIPGIEQWKEYLVYLHGIQHTVWNMFETYDNGTVVLRINKTSTQHGLTEDSSRMFFKSEKMFFSFVEEAIWNVTEKELLKKFSFKKHNVRNVLQTPPHLEKYVESQLRSYVKSVLYSRLHVRDQSYVVENINFYDNSMGILFRIVPVDQNTGVMQFPMTWGEGLDGLLSIRESISLHADGVVSVFLPYPEFFKMYAVINGWTGTLGNDADWSSMRYFNNVSMVSIPPFIEKDIVEFAPKVFFKNESHWLKAIVKATKEAVADGRGIIIGVDSVLSAKRMVALLKHYGVSDVREYGTAPSIDDAQMAPLAPGSVVVATPFGGRGTDWSMTHEVKISGGVHLILTYYPTRSRDLDQWLGRVARNELPGSTQLIVNMDELPLSADPLSIYVDDWQKIRQVASQKEYAERREAMIDDRCRNHRSRIEYILEKRLFDLQSSVESPTGYNITTGVDSAECQRTPLHSACIYFENDNDKDIMLVVLDPNTRKPVSIRIGHQLAVLNPKVYGQIRSVLAAKGKENSLSRQAHALLQFEIGLYGYSQRGTVTMQHVIDAYQAYIPSDAQPSLRINELLEGHGRQKEMNTFFSRLKQSASWLRRIFSGEEPLGHRERRAVFSVQNFDILTLPPMEIAFLEGLAQDSKSVGYCCASSADVTLEKLQQTKLKHLFHLWTEDLKLYNKEWEKKQLRDHWAFELKSYEPTLDEVMSKCIMMIDGQITGHESKGLNIATLRLDTKQLETMQANYTAPLLEKFESFAFNMAQRAMRHPCEEGSILDNAAYVIAYGLQLSGIHEHQRQLYAAFLRNRAGQFAKDKLYYHDNLIGMGYTCFNRAIDIDPNNFATWNARAYWRLVNEMGRFSSLKEAGEARDQLRLIASDWQQAYRLIVQGPMNSLTMQVSALSPLYIKEDSILYEQLMFHKHMFEVIANSIKGHLDRLSALPGDHILIFKRNILLSKQLTYAKPTAAPADSGTEKDGPTQPNAEESSRADKEEVESEPTVEGFDDVSMADTLHSLKHLTHNNHSIVAQEDSPIANMLISEIESNFVFLYEVDTKKLKKPKKKWWKVVLIAMMEIATIAIGVSLLGPGAGLFAQAVGTGLIANGVGGLLTLLQQVCQGQPIDFAAYLKNKVASVALILITATISHVSGLEVLGDMDKFNWTTHVAKQFAVQGGLLLANMGIRGLAKHALFDADDVHGHIAKAIDSLMQEPATRQLLTKMFAKEAWTGDTSSSHSPSVLELLKQKAFEVSFDYRNRYADIGAYGGRAVSMFGDPTSQFIVGTAVAVASTVNGYIHYDRMAGDFKQQYGDKLRGLAPVYADLSRQDMYLRGLRYSFGPDVSSSIMKHLQDQRWSANVQDLQDFDCEGLLTMAWDDSISNYQEGSYEACLYVNSQFRAENHAEKIRELSDALKRIVYANAKQQFHSQVVDQVSAYVSSMFASTITENIESFIDDAMTRQDVSEKMQQVRKEADAELDKAQQAKQAAEASEETLQRGKAAMGKNEYKQQQQPQEQQPSPPKSHPSSFPTGQDSTPPSPPKYVYTKEDSSFQDGTLLDTKTGNSHPAHSGLFGASVLKWDWKSNYGQTPDGAYVASGCGVGTGGLYRCNLVPKDHDALGRTHLQIHERSKNSWKADSRMDSRGCIVTDFAKEVKDGDVIVVQRKPTTEK